MSIKVLVVDDETLERVLIINGFDWPGNGFEIIGEAGSGMEALEFVKHRQPDLILTDINMPRMDGLELSGQLREVCPDCRIVIITGYREFEYARKAVKLGVDDFLLKPINVMDIADVTARLKAEIEKENKSREEISELRNSVLTDQDVVRDSFFLRLVENRMPADEAHRRLMMYNCVALAEKSICLNIKILNNPENVHNDKLLAFIQSCNISDMLCFAHYLNNILLFFMRHNVEAVKALGERLHEQIGHKLQIKTTIGMSGLNTGIEGISKAYFQSEDACQASVLLGENRFISYDEYEQSMPQDKQIKNIDWDKLLFALSHAIEEQTVDFITEYAQILKQSGNINSEYLRLNAMDYINRAGSTLNKYGMDISKLVEEDELYQKVQMLSTLEDITVYLKEISAVIMEFHLSLKGKKENKFVKQAVEHIQENLCDPLLSLKTISAAIFTNESYLSRVFKREMGINIVSYIMKLRIEESIRLLSTTDLMVYEIAERIGFREAHYFSICFKKHTGLTVKEFKNIQK